MLHWLFGRLEKMTRKVIRVDEWLPTRGSTVIVLAALAVCIPIMVVVLLALTGETWFPAGDMAQAELHMRGFFSHPPLVGAAGRIVSDDGVQGSHPGPSLWVAMLPVYLLGGRTSSALMGAVVSVHVTSVLAILWLSYRRAGRAFVAMMAVALMIIIRSSGPDFIVEPWNPWLAVLPFAVFVFLVAEVVLPTSSSWQRHRHFVLGACVLVGSHCIQSHAGYVVIVVGGLALALGAMVWSEPRSGRLKVMCQAVPTAGGVGLVMWLPPIVDQLRREPGNFEILWQHFASPSEPAMSLTRAGGEIASQMNLIGPWLTGPDSTSPALGWARYPGFVAFSVLIVLCWRMARSRQWTDLSSLLQVSSALMVIGSIAISRIFGPFFEYTIRWMWILVAIVVSVCAVIMWRFSAEILNRQRCFWVAIGVSLSSVLIVSSAIQLGERFTLPGPTDSRITSELHQQLVVSLDPTGRYLVRFYDPYTLNATGFGVTLALERSGFDVGVDPIFAAAALPHRTRLESSSDLVLWVVVGPAIARATSDPDLNLEALFDPRSPEEQASGKRLLDDIARGLEEANRGELLPSLEAPGASLLFAEPPLPDDVAALVRELILLGQPVAVFSMPPGATPSSLQ